MEATRSTRGPRSCALERLIETVGAPRNVEMELGVELDALDVIGREPFLTLWSCLPREAQQLWLGMLVARTRAVKQVGGLPPTQRARVKTIISRYPPWAGEHRPGHVHGLRVDHEPQCGSWEEDARRLWKDIETLLEDRQPRAKKEPSKKKRDARDEPSVGDLATPRGLVAALAARAWSRCRHGWW